MADYPYYGMDGQLISRAEGLRLFEDVNSRQVGFTELEDGTQISTVLLVIDHSFGDGPPLLFETMVFGNQRWEEFQRRYRTAAEAREGHEEIVRRLRAGESLSE